MTVLYKEGTLTVLAHINTVCGLGLVGSSFVSRPTVPAMRCASLQYMDDHDSRFQESSLRQHQSSDAALTEK
ncbi:hypothetical protein J6590_027148 [Homalodisca vitripennis]|nr:hypothetical protein J6590_027148 [Homalodisca vitripennis]